MNDSTDEGNHDKPTQANLLEARRVVYGHCVDLHKYFLTWRERLLAGYATMLAALAIAYAWAYSSQNSPYFTKVVCCAGILLTFIFWLLDRRTRDLYRACIEAGFNIEKDLGIVDHTKGQIALYDSIRISSKELKDIVNAEAGSTACARRSRFWHGAKSHSGAINLLAIVAIVGMIILLFAPHRPPAGNANIGGIDSKEAPTSQSVSEATETRPTRQ